MAETPHSFKVEIVHKEWIGKALEESIHSLELIRDGVVPEVLRGRFIVTSCMRMLRCVLGTNADNELMVERLWQLVRSDKEELERAMSEPCPECNVVNAEHADSCPFFEAEI